MSVDVTFRLTREELEQLLDGDIVTIRLKEGHEYKDKREIPLKMCEKTCCTEEWFSEGKSTRKYVKV